MVAQPCLAVPLYSSSSIGTLQLGPQYLRAACHHQGKLAVTAAGAFVIPPRLNSTPTFLPDPQYIAAEHVAEQTAIASTICVLCCALCLACAVFSSQAAFA